MPPLPEILDDYGRAIDDRFHLAKRLGVIDPVITSGPRLHTEATPEDVRETPAVEIAVEERFNLVRFLRVLDKEHDRPGWREMADVLRPGHARGPSIWWSSTVSTSRAT